MRRELSAVRVCLAQVTGVRVERYDYTPGFAPGIAPHAHDDWQIGYSPDGGGHIRAGRAWIEAHPHRLYCIPPAVEHTGARDATVERSASYFVLYISPDLVGPSRSRSFSIADRRSAGCITESGSDALRIAARLARLAHDDSIAATAEEDAAQLLAVIAPPARSAIDSPLARRVRDALMADPVRCATLTELARSTGAPPHSVRAAFKSAFGVPPARYHLLRRLQEVRVLLGRGVRPDVAALRLGFVDQAHMANRLRRYFGHTPGGILKT